MPQYTNTSTSSLGFTVTTVLDTEANIQTITVTAPTGQVATATQPANLTRPFSTTVNSLTDQLEAAGAQNVNLTDIGSASRLSSTQVVQQAEKAEAAALATDTPVPENPSPPPPVTGSTETAAVEGTGLSADNENPPTNILQQPPAVNDPGVPFDDVFRTETDELGNTITFDSSGRVVSTSTNPNVTKGLEAERKATQAQATLQDAVNFNLEKDWRLRLSLAPNAKYLYKSPNPGILGPLSTTNGVLFPYNPQVSYGYTASYEAASLPHTNFAFYQYKNSAVNPISIIADFTAQDTFEANYLLAVIHFFRSVTKMFYGKDTNPKLGTPPPLCYLNGYGPYQFNNHAVVISEFSYTLPKDVDYIRAGNPNYPAGVRQDVIPKNTNPTQSANRVTNGTGNIRPGGEPAIPKWNTVNGGTVDPTYVPTRIQFSITCLPIVTRGDIVNNFSLEKYATGELLLGSTRQGGGIW